jgi:hypothetical protein
MAGLEDRVRSAVPGGNIGKPLMLALLALLASGFCLEEVELALVQVVELNRRRTRDRAACSEDWVDCWTSCKKAVSAVWPTPGSAKAKINRCHPSNSPRRSAPISLRYWRSDQAFRKKS